MTVKRVARIGGAVAVLVAIAAVPGAAADVAVDETACPVVASATGLSVLGSASNNAFLSAPVGAVTPMAQACVAYALEDSEAFASHPYPGELVLSAPAIVADRLGQAAPDNPTYVKSRYPAVDRRQREQQGYALDVRSARTASAAQARSAVDREDSGAGALQASASTAVDPKARTAKSAAESDTAPLVFADVLELGRVHSAATATIDAAGKVVRKSQLTIGRTEVGGRVVEITPNGIRAGDQTAPLPEQNLAEALEAAGIQVRYLAAERTSGGVLAPGVLITVTQRDPDGAEYTAQYTIGRAFAQVAPVEAAPDGPAAIPTAGPPAAGPAAGGRGGTSGEAPSSGEAAGSGSAPESAPEPPATAGDAPAPSVAAPQRLVANPSDIGAEAVYLGIAFGAVGLWAGGMMLRLIGVRSRWTP